MRANPKWFLTYSLISFMKLISVDAADRFLDKLVARGSGKKKIIGEEFIRVFEEGEVRIDRLPCSGDHLRIRANQRVCQIPSQRGRPAGGFDFELVEPLKYLFKDEVRKVERCSAPFP